ncbi:hypothetical protein BASA50_003492 [Batrachochytrium salamandrivorans]|uniref:Glycoside hydrolase/deacetylase n=1 Tax=Batrachochytrium salamandrivorans TaxID=1357716 RepID=A0ABQ8FI09_9FUNG|nr:hypothetical protein BASA60_005103 [Batrachochytrium salamandrivorans]KAH6598451.1 hypothetical protein BASA50_003492 [Batrachochytrium salamandrivorans]KAH6599145.1 hypothetical protein BASA61_002676 [Batrachochytrium salamandrivorans]KAH9266858.1 hypothetical protein BASA84_000920 [Batrachochytrium salamandrivorans]
MMALVQVLIAAVLIPVAFGTPSAYNRKCGPNVGKCGPGLCCSQSFRCDVGPAYCGVGCQPAFGVCTGVPDTAIMESKFAIEDSPSDKLLPVSADPICGKRAGFRCGPGSCCSRFNYCGTTKNHCGVGCQLAFGVCSGSSTTTTVSSSPTGSLPISPDSTCGKRAGFKCAPGDCCSPYNFCGTTKDHCGVGCQSAFGVCTRSSTTTTVSPSPTGSLPISPDSVCGKRAGFRCGPGSCCSPYNFCGTTKDHCGVGCQSAFGVCTGSSTTTTVSSSPTPASTEFPAPNPKMAASIITTCTSPGLFALTLDDGPTKNVPGILDMLKQNNIKATFFVNGKNQADLTIEPFKSILLRAYTEGHQIGSHTLTHQDMTTLNFAQMWTEMKSNDDLIRGIIGKSPMYMRPPFGSINSQVLTAMGTWGYKVVTWNVDSNDWRHDGKTNMIALNDVSYANDMKGLPLPTTPFITLQHDYVVNEVEWDQHVITKFTALGYRFVTVGECLGDAPNNWYR